MMFFCAGRLLESHRRPFPPPPDRESAVTVPLPECLRNAPRNRQIYRPGWRIRDWGHHTIGKTNPSLMAFLSVHQTGSVEVEKNSERIFHETIRTDPS